jgi:prepilin-type N-terminal cleavage/methylation domain-containing protein
MSLSGAHRDDPGFTLVELLLAITILGIVMAALVAMMFGALTTDAATGARIDATRAEQFAATYFADDVQGAASTGGVVVGGTAQCGTETPVVEFRGTAFDPVTLASRMTAVAYVLRDTTANGQAAKELHRLACTAATGSSTPLAPGKDITVARGLATTPPAVTVSGSAVAITLAPLQGNAFSLVGTRRTS